MLFCVLTAARYQSSMIIITLLFRLLLGRLHGLLLHLIRAAVSAANADGSATNALVRHERDTLNNDIIHKHYAQLLSFLESYMAVATAEQLTRF